MFTDFLTRLKDTIDTSPQSAFGWVMIALLLAGIGVPLPEDIPLTLGGYACAQMEEGYRVLGFVNPVIAMCACGILAILIGDTFVYCVGYFLGTRVQKWGWVMRLIGKDNIEIARTLCQKKGGRFIVISRFMPGLRSPAFFAAGSLGMPYGKFLLCDGLASLISVPVFVVLGYKCADRMNWLWDHLKQGEAAAFIVILILVAIVIGYKMFVTKKIKQMKAEAEKEDSKNASI